MPRKKSDARRRYRIAFWIILAVAVLLRIAYVWVTPWDVRGHDASGHVQYIQYVIEHRSIPPPGEGFEFYHPPLYYFAAAPILAGARSAGMTDEMQMRMVQGFSLLLSILSLLLVVRIGRRIFPDTLPELLLFYSAVAFLPSNIFFAARINNDVLFQFFIFAGCASLLDWWSTGRHRSWIYMTLCTALGLLTKTNMVMLIPVAIACAFAKPKQTWTRRAKLTGVLLGGVALLSGWFPVLRWLASTDARMIIIGNVDRATGALPFAWRDFLVFNPLQVLLHPFNEVTGDVTRRSFHWEYIFRSALYGEFRFPDAFRTIALTMICAAFALAAFAARRLWHELRSRNWRKTMPMWLAALVVPATSAANRLVFPFSSSSDFRYSILFALPAAYYATRSLNNDRQGLRSLHVGCALSFIVMELLFMAQLLLSGM